MAKRPKSSNSKKRNSKPSQVPSKSSPREPRSWKALNREIAGCTQCPRLIKHCQAIGEVKRKAYADEDYWAGPVPNFGFAKNKMLIIGLAPGAHGANRTGRMFTGDRSGDWLYRALYRAGFCSQEESTDRRDGLKLIDCVVTGVCHCAPPDNKPTTDEISNCREFLERTIELSQPRVFLALGKIGFDAIVRFGLETGWFEKPRPKFHHGAVVRIDENRSIVASYHPSQQNTFTGRLTETMLDEIMYKAKKLCQA